jgi:hypothetical protein
MSDLIHGADPSTPTSRGTSSTPFGLEASGIPVAMVQDHGTVVSTGFPVQTAGETPPLPQSRSGPFAMLIAQ